MPMKVWRNRALANNQPLMPEYVFEGDMSDTQALEAWVFNTLK
jgi:hypothetical protein